LKIKKYVKLSDGEFDSKYSINPSIEIKEFPAIPNTSGLSFKRIERKLINQLITSKKFILSEKKDKLRPILNLSSIKGKTMLASDAHISCVFEMEEDFGFVFFSPTEIDLVNKFEYFDYAMTESWNVIKFKTIVFGSRYAEGVDPGFVHGVISNFISTLDKKCFMKLNVKQFYNFCKDVKPYVKDDTVNSILEVCKDSIKLSYEDEANGILEKHKMVDAQISGFEIGYKISFVQSSIVKVLDSLDSDLINISECVSSDGSRNFIGFWLDSDPSFPNIASKAL